jgi:hypothetical protein
LKRTFPSFPCECSYSTFELVRGKLDRLNETQPWMSGLINIIFLVELRISYSYSDRYGSSGLIYFVPIVSARVGSLEQAISLSRLVVTCSGILSTGGDMAKGGSFK